jgi:hypothetical protein
LASQTGTLTPVNPSPTSTPVAYIDEFICARINMPIHVVNELATILVVSW